MSEANTVEQIKDASSVTPHLQTWPCDASQYRLLGKKIGRGAFSSVWRAMVKTASEDEEQLVAVKIMDLENISTSFENILQEVQTMRLCDDDNILRCHCSFVHGSKLWLVTQLMDKGSCLRVMAIAKSMGLGEGMNEEWFAYVIREVLQGLSYLHSNGQIHRDIKSGNILLDTQGGVRLADFGVSGWTVSLGQRQKTVNTFVGTPCYMAPEVMEQTGGYDHRADIWSLGITALELAKGHAPYATYPAMRVLVMTIEDAPPSLRSYDNQLQRNGLPFSKTFDDFYTKCLQKCPDKRPSAEELLKHKFLKNRSRDAILHQLLSKINSVGLDVEEGRIRLPGEDPILIESNGTEVTGSLLKEGKLPECLTHSNSPTSNPYVAGASWVFDGENESSSGVFRIRTLKPSISQRLPLDRIKRSGVLGSYSPASSPSARVNYSNDGIESFLEDFEKEAATIVSTDSKGIPNVESHHECASTTRAQQVQNISKIDSTSVFMDELEDILGPDSKV